MGKRILLLAFLLAALMGDRAAAEELPPELIRAAPEAAAAVDSSQPDMGFSQGIAELWERGKRSAGEYFFAGARSAAALLMGAVLLGAAEGIADGAERFTTAAGALWITAASAGDIHRLMGLGQRTIGEMALLSKAFLPAMAAASAAGGGITGASVRQAAAVFFSDLLLTLLDRALLPGVYIYIGLSAADAISGRLEEPAALIRKGITWCLCGLVGLFTGYLSLSGAVAGAVDRHALRVARSAVSAAVPVVGQILSQASESLLAGAGVLKAMIGAGGALAVLGLCLEPVIHLGCQYLLYRAASIGCAVAGPKPLAKLMKRLGDAFALILAMTAASAAVLLISLVSSLTAVSG